MQNNRPLHVPHAISGGIVTKRTTLAEKLVSNASERQNFVMRSIASLLAVAVLAIAIYLLYLRRMPSTDEGTAATQAISLTGVRSDLLQIAQAERANMALNGRCLSLDELISSGGLSMHRTERDGYTYRVNCSGADFQIVAQHPLAPEGSPIRYPSLAVDSSMKIQELPVN